MASVPIGAKNEQKVLVTSEEAIDFIASEAARVLSTPRLIGHMEMTARNGVLDLLKPGEDTVGTHVEVKHLAATPIGMQVTFRAEVIGVDNRRITFKVEAFDEVEKVGEGTHERFIVDVARFATRVQAKAAKRQTVL
jgi:fluoroacetyl-CoA thioesterase